MSSLLQGKVISFAPTLDTNAYATGDHMGTLMTVSGVADLSQGAVRIMTLDVIDKDKQAAALDVLFFNASPTVASSDNAALDISDAEMASKLVGIVSVASADYKAFSSNSVACLRGLDLVVQPAASTLPNGPSPSQVNLYAILCSRGSPTFSATGLQLRIGLEQI
jgi:hypothetical protein